VAVREFEGFPEYFVAERRQWLAAVIAAAALGAAGCASAPSGKAAGKGLTEAERVAVVTQRAQERWDLLLKGNVKAAYAYLSPGSRAVVSQERYESRTRVGNFRAVKVDKVSCEGETCSVQLFLTFDHRVMQGIVSPVQESWIFEDGQAWFVYRE